MKPTAFFVDKPEGMGSTDVVRHFKRKLPRPFKKIGHFGTLDPFATGLLIIGINGAQRLADYLHRDYPKTYRATGVLGISSDTGDKTGELNGLHTLEEIKAKIQGIDKEKLEADWNKKFSENYMQAPPAYSAAKFKGKNLYEYARAGIIIEKPKVPRSILNLKILSWKLPCIEFEVTVSSGTYIRVLFEDMARDLGTVGHLSQLRRTRVGPHHIDKCQTLESWPIPEFSVEQLFSAKEVVLKDSGLEKKYRNGIKLLIVDCAQHLDDLDYSWVKTDQGELLGLAKRVGEELVTEFNFPQNALN